MDPILAFLLIFSVVFILSCEIKDFRNQEGPTYYWLEKRRQKKNPTDPYLFNDPTFKK